MSSTQVEVEKVSKKRKHEGDPKLAKKKRKQLDETNEENGTEEPVAKSSKKEKRRKEKRYAGDDEKVQDEEQSMKLNGTVEPTSTPSKEKKKKKKRKDAEQEQEQPQPEAPIDADVPVADVQEDEDMPDAPEPKQHEPRTTEDATVDDEMVEETDTAQLQSDIPTSFYSTRMSLFLPIPAIATSGHLSALLALHISPLLLTYFPPASGVILSYHDPAVSARPEAGVSKPLLPPDSEDESAEEQEEQEETVARLGDEFGASWVWLTVTFLVFRPQPGDELNGWTNAMSEGFIGLVSYNYFQTSIAKSRIPQTWSWSGPSRQQTRQRKTPRKGKLNDSDEPSQEAYIDSQETVVVRDDDAIDGTAGSFLDQDGNTVSETLKFKVVDLEMIPAQERGQRFALQLEGTLLDEDQEEAVKEEERIKWETRQGKRVSRSRASTPGTPMMSGGLAALGRAASVVSTP